MKIILTRSVTVILVLSTILSQIACTKEKAEALKTAAKDFRTQASVAIDKLDKLFVDDVAFAPLSTEENITKVVISLKKTDDPGRRAIEEIVNESELRALDTSNYSKKLARIRRTYEEFEAMFEDLPRGHYFAGDAVARSEVLAKKLVGQMVFLGRYIKANPFRLNARLELAVQMRKEAQAELDPAKRENKFTLLAAELIAIRGDTKTANDDAILECAKGAEIGLKVVELIRNYKTMSVTDILSIVRDGLGRVNLLTGKNTDALMKRFDEIAASISSDPDWTYILRGVTAEMDS